MDTIYIVFSSVTLANRIKNKFSDRKNKIRIIHTPKKISQGGCSYSIVATEDKLSEITDFCRNANIRISGIYKSDFTPVDF